jgi:hypothetical protein
MADHELGTLREAAPISTTAMVQMTMRVTIHHYVGDVKTLLQLHAANLKRQRKVNWLLYALISLARMSVCFVSYYLSQFYPRKLIARCNC